MSEIHTPIDYSDLKDSIPPGEEIIYSTLAKGTLMQMNSRTTWICHLLITNKTLAYSVPKKKSVNLMFSGGNVVPLYDVKNFAPKIIWVYNEVGRGTLLPKKREFAAIHRPTTTALT